MFVIPANISDERRTRFIDRSQLQEKFSEMGVSKNTLLYSLFNMAM